MIDYKSTLNLPETKFPMKGKLVHREPEILKRWNDDNLYQIIRENKKGKKIFILHDGPPYANGQIHIGHCVNKILKDIVIKSKGMSGYNSPYIPGWDCHGLPIEHKIEQMIGKPGDKVSYANFRTLCRKFAYEQIEKQKVDFMRLGILGNWNNPYLTMNFETEANIIRVLGKFIKNGYLYKGTKPVHWCIDCCSSLAEAEVEYHDNISSSIDVMFKCVDPDIISKIFKISQVVNPISLVIWTTTPWTIPANRAIAVNPEFYYQLIKADDLFLILAKDLLLTSLERIGIRDWTILGECKGKQLELKNFKNPFFNNYSPVVLSEHVTRDIGTGAVHIAPSHGMDDYIVSKKYGIKNINLIGPDGYYLAGIHPLLDNIKIFQSNTIIIDLLKNKNLLLSNKDFSHNYPHCWRHKTPIIFRTTPQWFIDMDHKKLRIESLNKIRNVKWVPSWGQSCMESMLLNRPDWCISRQRLWGVPIPLFIHKETEQLHPDTLNIIEKVASLVEKHGIQIWWDLDSGILIKETNDYLKVCDVLDVWFDSGSTILSVVETRPDFLNSQPDMYLEGLDQYRGWFMSSLVISTALNNTVPYREVVTQSFTVDGKGRKMSKSLGNVISPKNIIKKFGADILRLWVASTDYSSEMTISDDILQCSSEYYRRIRNTIRFLLANLNDFNPKENLIKKDNMILIDKWAIGRAQAAQKDIVSFYEKYDFHNVVQRLMYFCSIEMSSFYLDIIKDRLYTIQANNTSRRSCQTALWHIIEALVRWIEPILSFTADEVWSYLVGDRSKYIFTEEWYKGLFSLSKDDILDDHYWNDLIKIRSEVNKVIEQARKNKLIGSSLEANIKLYIGLDLYKKLQFLGHELKFVFLTSSIQILDYKFATNKAYQSEIFKDLKIEFYKAEGEKCSRCWHYTKDIGTNSNYPEICNRCIENIVGKGEERKFV
ncbi:isoleucine--tRNA ligase [Candidatus Pantoea edessiphila]|uniref:Isoleucine--tRNA ligase n=1 Tax=Candidatus Pantoea edessiphila TaxID=2044610 RepID=A0A2P5T212_9GAMM|nr:isoleucine--tRNA ligase [Candidatus Pantoea edessiphila]PPI88631.1 isoleucine--tRNA ligase [Candidatus Pantoea edessiphila]